MFVYVHMHMIFKGQCPNIGKHTVRFRFKGLDGMNFNFGIYREQGTKYLSVVIGAANKRIKVV